VHKFYILVVVFLVMQTKNAMQTRNQGCIGCITRLHNFSLCENTKVMHLKTSLYCFSSILHKLHRFFNSKRNKLKLDCLFLKNSLIEYTLYKKPKKLCEPMQRARFYYFTLKSKNHA